MAALAPLCLNTAAAADIPLATLVRFNTVCARCHEGECSGRLRFDHGQESSGNHIRRHAGDVSPSAQGDLYAPLVRMMRACACFPMPAPVPKDPHWPAEALTKLRSPAGDAHFVPLGELATGRYVRGCASMLLRKAVPRSSPNPSTARTLRAWRCKAAPRKSSSTWDGRAPVICGCTQASLRP